MLARVNRCRLDALVLLVLCGFILSACVHTETGGFSEKKDDKKAQAYSEELARGYIREGNWDAAKRHLKVALDMNDSSAGAYEGMAMVYQNTGEYEQAAVNYKKAIRLEPDSSRIRLNYASFLYQQADYEKAAKELEIVTEDTLYPKRELAFANLGRCYLRLEDPENAEQAFMRAYLMDRRSPGIKLELAGTYFQLAKYSEAQKFYDAFREQVSTQSPQALWLGIQLAAQFDDRDALASYGLALKNLYPKSNEYLQYKSQYEND
jgi:type IV pilus assembly protein PilF